MNTLSLALPPIVAGSITGEWMSMQNRVSDKEPCEQRRLIWLFLISAGTIDDVRRGRLTDWAQRYRWPICFFVPVVFWTTGGAGPFGFMNNPPVAL